MAVCWHCPAQPMALVTLGIFSTLQWLKPSCYPLRKGFVSLVLLAVGPHGHQLWCREGTATRALLLVAGLVSAMTGEKSRSFVLESQRAEKASGTASSCAQHVATKGRDSPLELLGTGTALGPAPQRLPAKGAGWGCGGGALQLPPARERRRKGRREVRYSSAVRDLE